MLAACQLTPETDPVKQKNTVQIIDTVRVANKNEPDDVKNVAV